MASYRKSPEAERDMIDIWRYISKDSKSSATNFIDRLHGQMNDLATQPGLGRPRPEFGSDVRSFLVGDFLIFYRKSKIGVDVIRVLSGRRDLRSLFKQD